MSLIRAYRHLQRLKREARTFEIVAEHGSDGIVLSHQDGTIIWCNDAYCAIMRRPREFWIGQKPQKWVYPPDKCPSDQEIETFHFDVNDPDFEKLFVVRNMRGDGTFFWNQISLGPLKNGDKELLVVMICRDVTAQVEREEALKQAQHKLEAAVDYDALTGLANRRKLSLVLQESLGKASRNGTRVGLIHVDLDKFKEIKGHPWPCCGRRGLGTCRGNFESRGC